MKKYKIKTIQDIIDCTDENNLDSFLVDLKNLIKIAHTFQSINNIVAEMKDMPKEIAKIKTDGIVWIDDGKNNIKVTISTKKD